MNKSEKNLFEKQVCVCSEPILRFIFQRNEQ